MCVRLWWLVLQKPQHFYFKVSFTAKMDNNSPASIESYYECHNVYYETLHGRRKGRGGGVRVVGNRTKKIKNWFHFVYDSVKALCFNWIGFQFMPVAVLFL